MLQAGVNLDIARSRASEAVARAMGNETQVSIEQIRQKELEVRATTQAVAAKREEAAEIIIAAKNPNHIKKNAIT